MNWDHYRALLMDRMESNWTNFDENKKKEDNFKILFLKINQDQ